MRLVVIGGGILGCACARAAKMLGHEVILLEARQTLGAELTAAGHEWLSAGKSEVSVQLGAVGKTLLSQQLEMGNLVLLNAHAAAIAVGGDRVAGVVVATGFGTHIVACDGIVDTIGLVMADVPQQEVEYRYNFAVNGIAPVFLPEIVVPDTFGLWKNRVQVHPSSRPDCAVVQMRYRKGVDAAAVCNPQRELPRMQRLAAEVFKYLAASHPAFREAHMHDLLHNELTMHGVQKRQRPAPAGYHVLQISLPDPMSSLSLLAMYDAAAEEVARMTAGLLPAQEADSLLAGNRQIAISDCERYEDAAVVFQNGPEFAAIRLPEEFVPLRERVSVLVAGAGTAGIQTLQALCEAGIESAAVDLCALPGGTRSLGMVMSYWHGHKKGRNEAIDQKVHAVEAEYRLPSNGAEILVHNALTQKMEEHFYFHTIVCGAKKSGRRVESLYLCDFGGLFRIEADIMVDATGDGIAAYLSGASYMLGDERDGNIQTFSTWGENLWKRKNFMENRFHGDWDMADMDSYEDLLRCMYLGQHDNSDLRYSPLMTVRESRRIRGDYVLTLDDIWDEKVFEDTICVTLTPFDYHGKGSSIFDDMELAKFNGKEQRARIPYRCYIAADLDNMLVTAKAFSSTRDANSIGRMNPDLRHAGYAVGLCAAQAIRQGVLIREIDIRPVQEALSAQGILPEWTFVQAEQPSAETLMEQWENGDIEAALVLYRTEKADIRAAMGEYYRRNRQSDGALCLAAWHNIDDAAEQAYGRLMEILRDAEKEPDRRIIPYDTALRLMGALTYNGSMNTPQLAALIGLSGAGGACYYPREHAYTGKVYGHERIDGWKVPHFKFLYLLAQAVERRPDEALAAPMEALLGRAYIGGYSYRSGKAEEGCPLGHDMPPVFGALLEIRLSAAATRCRSQKGKENLEKYACDDRSLLRKFARKELSAMVGSTSVCPYTGDFTRN